MTAPTVKLPSKLSELILLAVKDAKACEADPRYRVTIDYWHKPFGETCYVCMAGAVMAKSLGIAHSAFIRKLDFETEPWGPSMLAIDDARTGAFGCALAALDGGASSPLGEIQQAAISAASLAVLSEYTYAAGRAPWLAYERAAAILAEAGL